MDYFTDFPPMSDISLDSCSECSVFDDLDVSLDDLVDAPASSDASDPAPSPFPYPRDFLPRLHVLLRNSLSTLLSTRTSPDMISLPDMMTAHSHHLHARNSFILQTAATDWPHFGLQEVYKVLLGGSDQGLAAKLAGWLKLDGMIGDLYTDSAARRAESNDSMMDGELVLTDDEQDMLEFLLLLREFALNRYLLRAYYEIREFESGASLSTDRPTKRQKRSNSSTSTFLDSPPPVVHPRRRQPRKNPQDEYVMAYMRALAFVFKLQLMLHHEQPDPEGYWTADHDHPESDAEEEAALLYQKGLFTWLMLCYHEDGISDTLPFWEKESKGALRSEYATKRNEEVKGQHCRFLHEYLDIAESTREEWFYDEEEVEVERRKDVEKRQQGPSEFSARLKLVGTKARKSQKQNVNEWMERVVGERPAHSRVPTVLSELEKSALEGTTWTIESLENMSSQEAEVIISMYGGKIHQPGFTNPTHTLVVSSSFSPSQFKPTVVTESSLFSYIRSRVLEARLYGAPHDSLRGKSISFSGILPTISRKEAEELVMRFSGTLIRSRTLDQEPDYLVRGVRSSEDSEEEIKLGESTIVIDEDSFIKMVKEGTLGEARRSGRIARRKSVDNKKRHGVEINAKVMTAAAGAKRKRRTSA